VDVDSPHVATVPTDYESQDIQTDTQLDRIEREAATEKRRAKAEAEKIKAKGRKEADWLKENRGHPVVLGNALLSVALFGAVGYGAYAKYRAGEFGWKVVGLGVAILGAFSAADYYATK
jgi:hypothetical protein